MSFAGTAGFRRQKPKQQSGNYGKKDDKYVKKGVHLLVTDHGLRPPPALDRVVHRVDTGFVEARDSVLVVPADEGSVPGAQYSTEELSMAVATTCVCALVIGFIMGFLMARKCACGTNPDLDNPYHVPYLNQLVEP